MTKNWERKRRWALTHALKHEWRAQFAAKKAEICVDFESFSHGSEWLSPRCCHWALGHKNKVGSPRVWLCQPRGFLLWVATCSACESVFRRPPVDQHLFYFQTIYSLAARVLLWLLLLPRTSKSHQQPLSMVKSGAAEMRLPVRAQNYLRLPTLPGTWHKIEWSANSTWRTGPAEFLSWKRVSFSG